MQMNWIDTMRLLMGIAIFAGCLPKPKTEVKPVPASLTIQGRLETSLGTPASMARIYLEQELRPEAMSDSNGNFSFSWSSERLADLRLRYGIANKNLRLYFESSDLQKESNTLSSPTLLARDTVNIGTIRLAMETILRAKVTAQASGSDATTPIEYARVRLGRHEFLTDAKGEFVATAPQGQNLPVLIEKVGYVQSQAIWAGSEETSSMREFRLFASLQPIGTLEALPSESTLLDKPSTLVFTATSFAKWLRLSTSEADLRASQDNPLAPWRPLDTNLILTLKRAAGTTIFYQFADENQKILGPLQNMSF